MLAYSSFALAVAHGSIMIVHEASLRKLKQKRISSSMPSLLEMDASLVRVLFVSFVLISATLLSGGAINSEIGRNFLVFDHKTLFAIAAWFVVFSLLTGRIYFGWRGRFAARWTIPATRTLSKLQIAMLLRSCPHYRLPAAPRYDREKV